MGISLKENGLFAVIYKWFYCTIKLPQSLCPFFWKELIAILLGIPVFIFTLPTFYWYLKDLKKLKEDKLNKRIDYWYIDKNLPTIKNGWYIRLISSFCIWGIVFFIFKSVLGILDIIAGNLNTTNAKIALMFILCITLVLIIGGGVYLVSCFQTKKKPEVIVIVNEFIKAKIGKYCPKITWK